MAKEKEELVSQLTQVAQYMEILGENDFKVRAFRKGADAIEASSASLAEIADGSVKVPGVGDGLRGAVKEFVAAGAVAALGELSAKVPAGVLELMKVPGLGPKKALVIFKELGVASVGELEYACRENRLTTLKGFGDAVQKKILKSIEDMNANAGKLRIDEAIEKACALETELRRKLPKRAEITRVGALGRSCEIVERLEFHFSGSASVIADVINVLPWNGGLEEMRETVFGAEVAGFSGSLADGTLLTLWVSEEPISPDVRQWLCASPDVRPALEAKPKSFAGYELSWLEPEWVGSGRAPKAATYRRARDGRVKGVFHCHTNFSDGAATLEEMVAGAEKRGYEYIGISDHSQSAFYAQGLKPERIREQRKMIDALQKKTSIKIFHGVESDILADGALDYDEELLESLDFVVGSIHSRFKMDATEMTARITRALASPHITMWGHPTGRLLLARRAYDFSWTAALDQAASSGAAVEFNANPHRLDVDWRLGAELERRKTPVFINPDAHSVDGLDDTVFGEIMAEKAMLPVDQIMNLKGAAEMEKHLCERKRRARH